MAKGNPNDATRKLNFVPKVLDPVDNKYKPLYIAPEATDAILGDVYLSDATDSEDNAATGVTAATPKAVKTVNDNANNKLDKVTASAQTVTSAVTFNEVITGNKGMQVAEGQYFIGNLQGNASTASQLTPGRSISVKGTGIGSDSVNFTGASDITITLGDIAAEKIKGVLSLSNIPQGAMERIVSYESVEAAITAWTEAPDTKPFDIGDTIRVTGVQPNVMYAVIADPSQEDNYVEYAAGTASEALHADNADTADKITNSRTFITDLSSEDYASFDGTENVTLGITGILPIAFGGTGATTAEQARENLEVAAKEHIHNVFTGATDSEAGTSGFVPAPSAGDNLRFLRGDGTWQIAGEVTGIKGDAEDDFRVGDVNLTPANIGAAPENHTHDYLPLIGGTLTGQLNSNNIIPSIGNTYNIGSSSIKYNNIYANTFNGDLSGNASSATVASQLNNTIQLSGDITSSAISLNTTSPITISATLGAGVVGFNELASEVGTIAVQSSQPTNASVKLWVKI